MDRGQSGATHVRHQALQEYLYFNENMCVFFYLFISNIIPERSLRVAMPLI